MFIIGQSIKINYLTIKLQVEDLLHLTHSKCPHSSFKVQLSLDGVQEARSNNVTTDVFSIKFENCKYVYPIRMIRPINRYKFNEQEQLQHVLDDLNDNFIDITDIIADNPKRSNMKQAKNSNGTFGCEYCEGCAIQIKDYRGIDEIKKKYETIKKNLEQEIKHLQDNPGPSSNIKKIQDLSKLKDNLLRDQKRDISAITSRHIYWPASTYNQPIRTVENIHVVTDHIVNSDVEIPRNEAKGFYGKSILLSQPNFHFVENMPTEYMHCVCLGTVKRLTEMTFSVGDNRTRVTKRKLCDPKHYNDQIKKVKIARESSRRCRQLDFSVKKASEFRNMILFYFIIVIDCIGDEHKIEQNLWLDLAFVIRACVITNEEFHKIDKKFINKCCQNFYNNYEKMYGPNNCTYSIHIVCSHLLQMRGKSPLTSRSAFCFESFYSEMKNLFCPGTISPLKQVLQNTIMKRKIGNHQCQNSIVFNAKPKKENRENNHSVYTLTENGHNFYSIISSNDDDTYTCVKQGKFNASFNDIIKKNWSDVGVYKLGPLCTVPVVIKKKDIAGKVIQVNNHLITYPNNVLLEQ